MIDTTTNNTIAVNGSEILSEFFLSSEYFLLQMGHQIIMLKTFGIFPLGVVICIDSFVCLLSVSLPSSFFKHLFSFVLKTNVSTIQQPSL